MMSAMVTGRVPGTSDRFVEGRDFDDLTGQTSSSAGELRGRWLSDVFLLEVPTTGCSSTNVDNRNAPSARLAVTFDPETLSTADSYTDISVPESFESLIFS
jgi:hypothetical protein